MNRSTYTAVAENASAVRQIDAVVLGRCSAYQISIEKSEQSAGSDGRSALPQGTAGRPGVIDALRAGGRARIGRLGAGWRLRASPRRRSIRRTNDQISRPAVGRTRCRSILQVGRYSLVMRRLTKRTSYAAYCYTHRTFRGPRGCVSLRVCPCVAQNGWIDRYAV